MSMAATEDAALTRLCGKEETLSSARELLRLAKAKTGPGSGHHLGSTTIGLPAICAFLAAQRLGNNDVSEKVAQQASCLSQKVFSTALKATRLALESTLQSKRTGAHASYEYLAREYGLNDDAKYWLEEVDKELRGSGALDDLQVNKDSIIGAAFYWTCNQLRIRAVKHHAIMQEFDIPLYDFEALQNSLESSCKEIATSIDKFVSENRISRSLQPSPSKSSSSRTRTPSPTKTPARRRASSPNSAVPGESSSPLKRKTSSIPAFPELSPTKKPRLGAGMAAIGLGRLPVAPGIATRSASGIVSGSDSVSRPTSPVKLNRLPVGSSSATRTSSISPTKTYKPARSIAPPVDAKSPEKASEGAQDETSPVKSTLSPLNDIAEKIDRLALTKTPTKALQPSNARVLRERTAISPAKPGPSTPTQTPRRRGRPPKSAAPAPARVGDSDVEMAEASVADIDESKDESDEEIPPPCRHRIPPFADRLFYSYRDPRVVREWEACERHTKAMIEKYGDPLERGRNLGEVIVEA